VKKRGKGRAIKTQTEQGGGNKNFETQKRDKGRIKRKEKTKIRRQ
jgi:hypothetical protein